MLSLLNMSSSVHNKFHSTALGIVYGYQSILALPHRKRVQLCFCDETNVLALRSDIVDVSIIAYQFLEWLSWNFQNEIDRLRLILVSCS